MNSDTLRRLERLIDVLNDCSPAAVAVSGGVDSMTLAVVTHRTLGAEATVFHAISPAVPPSVTARVRRYASRFGWRLQTIQAGEFDDPRYVSNPANRCFFCKQNLYGTIAANTASQLLSGTNLDDLGDWRPGLKAAANYSVRHPLVEAEIDKQGVRSIARHLELEDIAELPAAPCLSSRVETGLPIAAHELRFIDAAEQLVRRSLSPETVRCRIRPSGIVVELDNLTHDRTDADVRASLSEQLKRLCRQSAVSDSIEFAPYKQGSAFLRD